MNASLCFGCTITDLLSFALYTSFVFTGKFRLVGRPNSIVKARFMGNSIYSKIILYNKNVAIFFGHMPWKSDDCNLNSWLELCTMSLKCHWMFKKVCEPWNKLLLMSSDKWTITVSLDSGFEMGLSARCEYHQCSVMCNCHIYICCWCRLWLAAP